MRFDPESHRRRSIRLKGYDYSQLGPYFVTIVTRDSGCLFGEVVEGEMRMNDAGRRVHQVSDELAMFYPGVQTDAFIIMPNHIHGVIIPIGAGPRACPNETGQPQGVAPTVLSLPDVLHR